MNGDFFDPGSFFDPGDPFGEGLPPDPMEDLFGPWGPGGPFGVPPEDPFGPTGFDPPWGWGPEGPVYNPPPKAPWGWGPEGPVWEPPVETPPPASAVAVVVDVAFVAAIALLIVEVASIGHACWCIHDKNKLQEQVDQLNNTRDKAVQKKQWTDDLQQEWYKASDALARKGEQLQKELENTWIGWLIF